MQKSFASTTASILAIIITIQTNNRKRHKVKKPPIPAKAKQTSLYFGFEHIKWLLAGDENDAKVLNERNRAAIWQSLSNIKLTKNHHIKSRTPFIRCLQLLFHSPLKFLPPDKCRIFKHDVDWAFSHTNTYVC